MSAKFHLHVYTRFLLSSPPLLTPQTNVITFKVIKISRFVSYAHTHTHTHSSQFKALLMCRAPIYRLVLGKFIDFLRFFSSFPFNFDLSPLFIQTFSHGFTCYFTFTFFLTSAHALSCLNVFYHEFVCSTILQKHLILFLISLHFYRLKLVLKDDYDFISFTLCQFHSSRLQKTLFISIISHIQISQTLFPKVHSFDTLPHTYTHTHTHDCNSS